MTKRGVWALVATLVAALAFCGVASARSAPLGFSTAKRLARKLAEKQVRNRDIVSYHLVARKRLGRDTIGYAYDDRSTKDVYCTAALVVTKRVGRKVTTYRASFRGQHCSGVPADALAAEDATRSAVRDLRGSARATAVALANVKASVKRCRKLVVPHSRAKTANAVADIALVEALEAPNDAGVGTFVAALGQIQAPNVALARGIAGWSEYLAAIRALPRISDPCATLEAWARTGYKASRAPIDIAAYTVIDRRTSADERAIAGAARYLAKVGVFPRTVVEFTPRGLLLRLAPSLPLTGGKGKLVLRKPALL